MTNDTPRDLTPKSPILLARKFVDVPCESRAVQMSGEYNLRVINPDGTVKKETGWFPNIILDSGLNRWGTGAIILGAAIGTGTSTPTAVQTGLDAQTAYTTTSGTGDGVSVAQGSAPYYTTYTAVYRTTLGALNGSYSEVGVGWLSGSMFSRALILISGSPGSITVLSTEQLDIIYRLRIYPPTVDTSGVFSIGGTNYTVTGRASSVTAAWSLVASSAANNFLTASGSFATTFSGAIGAITAGPSGTTAGGSEGVTQSVTAYVNNSQQAVQDMNWSLTQGNVSGGIRSIIVPFRSGRFQYDFGASIPKDSTKTLVISASMSWARRP